MNGTKNDSGENSLYSDHDSNSESGVEPRQDAIKDVHHMEVDRLDDESNNWSRQSNAGSSEESDAEGHRDTMNITLESDISGAGNDPLDSIRSTSPNSDARNDDDRNHSIRIVNLDNSRKRVGSSRSGSMSPIDKSVSGYSSSVDVKSPMEVRSHSVSPVEVKSGSSSPVDINSESDDDDVDSINDEKEINTIDSDSDDEDCMIVDDATKAKAREANSSGVKSEVEEIKEEEVEEIKEEEEEELGGETGIKKEEEEAQGEGKGEESKEREREEVKSEKVKEEREEGEGDTPTVRRSLRNTQRKKYEVPGEDDIPSDDNSKKKDGKEVKGKSPVKAMPLPKPIVSNMRAISIGQQPIVRFPNAINMGINKGLHNGVVSSNVINNMAQRGVSITPSGINRSVLGVPPKKPPIRPKRQPPFPPDSIFANMSPDMSIIEAPSFLSPFMFVKKPAESLKQFVEEINKELEEEKKKEEARKAEEERKLKEEQEAKAKLEKEKMDKEMLEMAEKANSGEKMEVDGEEKEERGEKRENGEAGPDEPAKKKVARRRRKKDEEADESWSEGEASDSSEDDEPDTIILKSKDDALGVDLLKVPTSRGEIKSDLDPKVQAYFSTPLGNFFIDIGFNLVQERVQTDLLKLQQKKLKHNAKSVDAQSMEAAMNLLTTNIERLKRDNFPFNFSRVRCQFCSFKTESALVMANHMEVPHTAKNGLFRCNFCPAEFQSPQLILSHVSLEHGVTARLLKPQSAYECADCPFESQTKGRYIKHVEKCSKLQTEVNILKPQEWQPPAKLIKASARPSYNYSYRPRAPLPVPRPPNAVFRPVHPTPVIGAGVRPIRPNDTNLNSLLVGMRPRPVVSSTQPRPNILGRTGALSNLKCGMCGSYYPDATRLREHVMKDHARASSVNVVS